MKKNEIENFYSHTGIQVENSQRLSSQQNYRIYLVNEKYVFSEKPNLGDGSRKKMYKILRKRNIPVPTEMFFWQNKKNNYYVESFINGKPASSLEKIKQPAIYIKLGRLLRRINEVDMQYYGSVNSDFRGLYSSWSEFIGGFYRYQYEHMKIVPKVVSNCDYEIILWVLKDIIKKRDFQPKLLHGDIKGENVICANNGRILGILDWESSISGDTLLEYANLCLWSDFRPQQKYLLYGYNICIDNNFDYKHFYGYQLFTAFITLCKLFFKGRQKEVEFLSKKIHEICMKCRFL